MPNNQPSGCLLAFLKLFRPSPGGDAANDAVIEELPYQRKDDLLSKAERSFFGVLRHAVADKYYIFPKIRLADVVFIPRGTTKYQAHLNRIQSKHLDFVPCDCESIRPLLAIELDDSSHQRADRQRRDDFLDCALMAAGLPLLRVPVRHGYQVDQLKDLISERIEGRNHTP